MAAHIGSLLVSACCTVRQCDIQTTVSSKTHSHRISTVLALTTIHVDLNLIRAFLYTFRKIIYIFLFSLL